MLRGDLIETYYGKKQVLFGTSLEVREGELVALMGRNGMGKTTTVHSVIGILRPRVGSIYFNGQPVSGLPPYRIARLGIGVVPEGRQVFPTLTVRENLVATAANYGRLAHPWSVERVFELFPQLRQKVNQLGATLSGGEQQMLAIGRALMLSPRLLILDEPSMGLAPVLVEQIFETIVDINRQGTTILLVEQNAAMALAIAHRGYVLETG